MYEIELYETADGFSDVREFIHELRRKSATSKEARIQYKQIVRYIDLLEANGFDLPVEVAKRLGGDIWELRPGSNRVFFFYFDGKRFVLLHHYRKKSMKTPKQEIERAKSEMRDYVARRKKGKRRNEVE